MNIVVHHGTTRWRAEQIVQNGPDPAYHEPFDPVPSQGFCVALADCEYYLGSPEEYARRKAKNFPSEGGPVILEMEIPEDILKLGSTELGDYQFEAGHGMTELLKAWPTLLKRIIVLD